MIEKNVSISTLQAGATGFCQTVPLGSLGSLGSSYCSLYIFPGPCGHAAYFTLHAPLLSVQGPRHSLNPDPARQEQLLNLDDDVGASSPERPNLDIR